MIRGKGKSYIEFYKIHHMSRCSYTWEEWDAEKKRLTKKQCQEKMWERSAEYCLFHDPSMEKSIELFREKIEEQLDDKNCNFIGYCFPKGWNFKNQHFDEYTDFRDAIFQGSVYFWGATFCKDVEFCRITIHKDADFSGATFQGTADFREATFWGYADFKGATYCKDADFKGATFQNADFKGATFQNADFKGATFQNADFWGATFQNADFWGATFQNANFIETTFQNAFFRRVTFCKDAYFGGVVFREDVSFYGTTFREYVELSPKEIQGLNLEHTRFLSRCNITANLTKSRFYQAYLDNVTFIDCAWPRKIYEEVHIKDRDVDLSFKELETIYRNLKQNMQRHGDYSKAGDFYYREMECRKKAMRKKVFSLDLPKSFGYSALKYTCGYGEKPLQVINNSLLIILLGAITYFFSGIARVGAEIPPESGPYIIDYSLSSLSLSTTTLTDFSYCLYYSVVTFTTLGSGDIQPLGISHIFAFLEAFIGAFFIALFVLVFARKMMR